MPSHRLYFHILPLLAAATLSACASYQTRRAAMVSAPAPDLVGPAPMETLAEVGIAHAGLARGASARLAGGGTDDGLEIVDDETRAEVRLRFHEHGVLGLVAQYAHGEHSRALAPDQPDVEGNIGGAGFNLACVGWFGDGDWAGKLGGEMLFLAVPYTEDRVCVDDCDGFNTDDIDHSVTIRPVLSLSAQGGRRVGGLLLFAGVKLQNHLTTERTGSEGTWGDADADIGLGRFNAVASLGAELAIGPVHVSGLFYQSLRDDPVAYGPAAALGLRYAFGKPRDVKIQ